MGKIKIVASGKTIKWEVSSDNVLVNINCGVGNEVEVDVQAFLKGEKGDDGNVGYLGRFDYWKEISFLNSGQTINDTFAGTSVSGGFNNGALPVNDEVTNGLIDSAISIVSNTPNNGGMRYQTSLLNNLFFGQKSRKYISVYLHRTSSFTGRIIRDGFHNTISILDATNGAYFENIEGVVVAKTANNSIRTLADTNYTLSLDVWYRFEIDANAAATSVRFRIFNHITNILLYDKSLSTNIPNTRAQAFGAGIVATSNNPSQHIIVLHKLGIGTILAFEREYGIY